MNQDSFKPCALDYTKCIECDLFEECLAKEFVSKGKYRIWFPLYMAALFAGLIYFLVL